MDNTVQNAIDSELTRAASAKEAGREGRVRVCARRAANAAITVWLRNNPRPVWGPDAISRLTGLSGDTSQPAGVREAAHRLSARIDAEFRSPSTDPIADSRAIIAHLIGHCG
jgi:hypothetical protein